MPKEKINQSSERIIWLDIVRIVAIALVVCTHSIGAQTWTPLSISSDWVINDFYTSLFRICVPLFIMVSGALLLDKIEPYTIFFTKRATKVIIPWILWTFIYMVWNVFSNGIAISTPYAFLKSFYIIFMSQFWFLPMITGIYLLTPLLRVWIKHARKLDVYYALALWFGIYSIYPFIHKIISPEYAVPVPFVLEHLGYFLLGYVIYRWINVVKYTKILILIFVLSVMANSFGTFAAFGINRLDLQGYFWNNLSFFIVVATIASFLLIRNLFEKQIFAKDSKAYGVIITLSNASFGIFFVHVIIIQAMQQVPAPFPIPYFLATLLYALIVYLISLGIILLIQKTPAKKYLAT